MRKLSLFIIALALVTVGLSAPASAGVHDGITWVMADGFDTYNWGSELQAGSGTPPLWTTTVDAGQPYRFLIEQSATAFTPSHQLRMVSSASTSGGTTSGATAAFNFPGGYVPPSGIVWVHMRVKSPNHNPSNNVDWSDLNAMSDNTHEYGRWRCSETYARPRVGGGKVGNVDVDISDGLWHELDIKHDLNTRVSTWYADDVLVWTYDLHGMVSTNWPSSRISGVRIDDTYYKAGFALLVDDVKAGSDVVSWKPAIAVPEATCSGKPDSTYVYSQYPVLALCPEIDWECDPFLGYEVRIFTSPQVNPAAGTPVYSSVQTNNNENWHVVQTPLAEGTTYYPYVRVRTAAQWQPWSDNVDFKCQATANETPTESPVLVSPTPVNNGYYRGQGGALVAPTIAYTLAGVVPVQSMRAEIGTMSGDPAVLNWTTYADTPYLYSWLTDFTGSYNLGADPSLGLGNMTEWQTYYLRIRTRNGCDTVGSSNFNVDQCMFKATLCPVTTGVQPAGGVVLTTRRPTITWNIDTDSPTPISSGTVRITDSPDATPTVYTYQRDFPLTGLSGDPGTFTPTEDLPEGIHLYAFVRLTNSAGLAQQYSPNMENQQYPAPTDEGGFFIATSAPNAPTIVSPAASESITTAKPRITFSGDVHDKIEVKICTTNNSGAAGVWESGQISSTTYSRACTTLLADGTYYAFVRIHNPIAWSGWTTGRQFSVSRNDSVNIRHMDEAGLTSVADANPDTDMFGFGILDSDVVEVLQQNLLNCGTGNGALRFDDFGHSLLTQGIRRHRVGDLDLDKGVTVVTAVAVDQDPLYPLEGAIPAWQQGQIFIVESADSGRWVTSFRVEGTDFGICTNNSSWTSVARTDDPTRFTTIRITGRNLIAGNPATCVWKMYANEQLVATANGCMPESIDPGEGWMVDSVALGQGEGRHQGVWQYDYLAVNTNGDYAPGEWDYALGAPNPGGGTRDWNAPYAGIGDARNAKETAIVSLTGLDALVTNVVGSPQTAFYAQDKTGGIKLTTTDTKSNTVAAGKPVTAISGVIPFPVNVTSVAVTPTEGDPYRVYSFTLNEGQILAPTFTLGSGVSTVAPMAMSQKALGGGCVDQLAGSGQSNLGMLVRVFGKVVYNESVPEPFPMGTQIIVIDDGSGSKDVALQGDGSYAPVTGLTITLNLNLYSDPGATVGTDWMIEGISSYEGVTGGLYPTARRILFPTLTQMVH